MELSIVVPVYNSSSILSELCSQLVDALSDIDIEIILVDDGSQDSSWRVIKQLAEQIESVQGFRLTRNFGQDNAIMAGLNHSSGFMWLLWTMIYNIRLMIFWHFLIM